MSAFPPDEATSSFSYSQFTSVKPRKKRKNRQQERPSPSVLLQCIRDEMSQDSEWFSQCLGIVKDSLKSLSHESPPSVLCLGLGSPSTSPTSRVQLAFLTELCSELSIDHAHISVYDPVFTPEDMELFKRLHFQVLSENRNAEYTLREPTICYMPHCDMELYDSLLRANWSHDQAQALILLGNRLEEYRENNPHQKLQERVPHLFRMAPVLDCHPLPQSKAWPIAFNNTAIQYVRLPDNLPENWFSEAP